MSEERLVEINKQLQALKTEVKRIPGQIKELEMEAKNVRFELVRKFLEEFTGLEIPEDVKTIEYNRKVMDKCKSQWSLNFNGEFVQGNIGTVWKRPKISEKYVDFTNTICNLTEGDDERNDCFHNCLIALNSV